MQLRPYQIENKLRISDALQEHQAVVMCMPTGAGKTVCFADIAKGCLASGAPVLIICNRRELIAQAKQKLNDEGLFPTLIIPSYKDHYSNLYLASVDTLRNRKLPDVKVVIIDEAHLKSFDEIALEYKSRGALIVGATATPIRGGKSSLDAYPHYSGQMGDIYDHIVEVTNISSLIEDGYIVPAIYHGPQVEVKNIKTKKTAYGKDYDEKQMFEMFDKPGLYAGVVDNYIKFAPETKALVFNINVQHSIKMTAAFNVNGIKSMHVDGSTPIYERKAIFDKFKRGEISVLNNCAIATTGYDEPSIETIIINRVTASLSLWLQMCGRGGRPYEDKNFFRIIDQGGNVYRHGFWHQDREWSLEKEYVSKTEGVAPIKECPSCAALIYASARTCMYCQAAQEMKAKDDEAKLLNAEFGIIDADNIPKNLKKELYKMSIPELEEYRSLKKYSLAWVCNQLYSRGDQAIKDYARFKNYSEAWVYRNLKIAEEKRVLAKAVLWEFLLDNPHADEKIIKEYTYKKLRASHSAEMIEVLLPKIIDETKKLHYGTNMQK